MDYNECLIQTIKSKFSLDEIEQFGINSKNFFMISTIGKKLKELFENLNDEYKKIINNNFNFEYYLLGIRRNIYGGENHQILDDALIELLNDEENIALRNSFDEIINYINSLP